MRRLLTAAVAASVAAPALAARTYTVGVGGEYPDLNAAVAAALSDPAVVHGGEQRQDIVFAVTRDGVRTTAPQKISGWRAGAFTTTLRPVAGQGFREYLRAHPDRPLYFDPAYGAFLTVADASACVQIDVANATIFGMQISCTGGAGQTGPGFTASPGALDSSIVLWQGYAHIAPGVTMSAEGGTLRVQNSLIVGTDPRDSMTIAAAGTARIFSYDNILAMAGPATINQGAGIFSGVHVIVNTAAFNFGACSGGVGGENNAYDFDPTDPAKSSGSNNLTCFPHFLHGEFAHRGQVGASFAREIVGRADWRLAPTALQMRGTGAQSAGGITVDILGRPRNTPDDIGPWAFPGGTPVPDLRRAQSFAIGAGTTAWTVPAACNGPANSIEALGAGGPGGDGVAGQGPGRGGGGGEYALRYGYPFTAASPGTTITVAVGRGREPGEQPADTLFGAPPFVRAVAGQAGGSGHDAPGGLGGRGGSGMVLHDGGDAGATHGASGGTGGGGAAGRLGDGAGSGDAAADGSGAGPGTGGGGNDGGAASGPTGNASKQGTAGGAGTGGRSGSEGGAQGALAGGAGGPNGGGGGGGTVFWYADGDGGAGGIGGAGTGFGGGLGPGGGGGGGAGPSAKGVRAGAGGDGGSYGGGGGGAGTPPAARSPLAGGHGAPGLIVVRCVRAS